MNDQNTIPPDWILETDDSIKARLEAAKEAQSRTRFTLIAMAIASIMMLVTAYNAYLSYDFEWARTVTGRQFRPTRTADEILTEQGLRLWADARNVYVPLFGIRISVDDVAIVGTGALVVLALWLMLSTRRENQTIGTLLRDTESSPSDLQSVEIRRHAREQRWRIFHTVIANSVYYCTSRSFQPITTLQDPDPAEEIRPTPGQQQPCPPMISQIESLFYLLPVIVCVVAFALDRRSYFIPDPFMPEAKPQGASGVFFWASLAMFVLLCGLLLFLCVKALQFSRATQSILQAYSDITRRDLEEGKREIMHPKASAAAGQGK